MSIELSYKLAENHTILGAEPDGNLAAYRDASRQTRSRLSTDTTYLDWVGEGSSRSPTEVPVKYRTEFTGKVASNKVVYLE